MEQKRIPHPIIEGRTRKDRTVHFYNIACKEFDSQQPGCWAKCYKHSQQRILYVYPDYSIGYAEEGDLSVLAELVYNNWYFPITTVLDNIDDFLDKEKIL
jgi:hypothetical protein